jgi:hypothetical protein
VAEMCQAQDCRRGCVRWWYGKRNAKANLSLCEGIGPLFRGCALKDANFSDSICWEYIQSIYTTWLGARQQSNRVRTSRNCWFTIPMFISIVYCSIYSFRRTLSPQILTNNEHLKEFEEDGLTYVHAEAGWEPSKFRSRLPRGTPTVVE